MQQPALRALTLALFVLLAAALASPAAASEPRRDDRDWQEFEEFRAWKEARRLKQLEKRSTRRKAEDDPPPIDQAALMARYIVNQAGNIMLVFRVREERSSRNCEILGICLKYVGVS